jgi:thiol-disulfide isomerase/thioredoxin
MTRAFPVLFLLACSGGADPVDPKADDDGDGLTNGEEKFLGTDKDVPDTDGDGYTDYQEAVFGSDPLDPADVIYQGGWPYEPDKDALGDPGFGGALAIGAQFPDLVGVDQYGDPVHLYDFVGQTILVDLSAVWCTPCQQLSAYLAGAGDPGPYAYPNVKAAVDAGELYWFEALLQNADYKFPASPDDAIAWEDAFPNPHVPVTAPANAGDVINYAQVFGYPTAVWLDPDLTVRAWDSYDPMAPIAELESLLAR